MTVHQIDPVLDSRWGELLERHPSASAFHTPAWLEALRRTYGYASVVLTTTPPGAQLRCGLVCCRVNSWLTGKRLVSLPFSDHCEPLMDDPADRYAVFSALEHELRHERLLYLEIRPLRKIDYTTSLCCSSHDYYLHQLDLKADLDTLFNSFHRSSTQRKIRRAERDGLTCEEGQGKPLLDIFYRLLLLTRRRHGLPPQPRRWFQNLSDCFGGALKIRVGLKNDLPVAAILTIKHKDILVYKYGCSDERFHSLGGMHFLFWRAIQDAKKDGLRAIDFGRSDLENIGLITFKDRWGSTRSQVTYSRFYPSDHSRKIYMPLGSGWGGRGARRVVSLLPAPLLSSAGDLLYRHLG